MEFITSQSTNVTAYSLRPVLVLRGGIHHFPEYNCDGLFITAYLFHCVQLSQWNCHLIINGTSCVPIQGFHNSLMSMEYSLVLIQEFQVTLLILLILTMILRRQVCYKAYYKAYLFGIYTDMCSGSQVRR